MNCCQSAPSFPREKEREREMHVLSPSFPFTHPHPYFCSLPPSLPPPFSCCRRDEGCETEGVRAQQRQGAERGERRCCNGIMLHHNCLRKRGCVCVRACNWSRAAGGRSSSAFPCETGKRCLTACVEGTRTESVGVARDRAAEKRRSTWPARRHVGNYCPKEDGKGQEKWSVFSAHDAH